MIRTLLTSTAIAALLTTGALAQAAPAPAPTEPAVTEPADSAAPLTPAAPMTPAPGADVPATDPVTPPATTSPLDVPAPAATPTELQQSGLGTRFDLSVGYTAQANDHLASNIIGSPIYSSTGDDAENIGNVSDIVINEEGEISAVVIGVGGFLGLGEKWVAADFSELQWTAAADGTFRWVLPTTREALDAAPEFIWEDDVTGVPAGGVPGSTLNTDPAVTPAPAVEPAPLAPATDPLATDPLGTEDPTDPALTTDPAVTDPALTTDPAVTPLDRSTLTDFDASTLTADELIGTTVYGVNDENLGTVSDFVLSDAGEVDAVIVDVGGFLGLGATPVALGFDDVQFSIDANNNRYMFVNVTREQLEAQPAFDRELYPTQRDTMRMTTTF